MSYNIEELSNAINLKKKVKFQYLTYNIDKKLVPIYPQDDGYVVVSPYYLIWAVNHYYLYCKFESTQKSGFLRVDKIKDVSILEANNKIDPLPHNFNVHEYTLNQAFMFGGENIRIHFRCQMRILGQVIDFFGEDVELKQLDSEHFEATVYTSIESIKYWILQYITAVDQIYPKTLNDIIIGFLEDALARNKTTPS